MRNTARYPLPAALGFTLAVCFWLVADAAAWAQSAGTFGNRNIGSTIAPGNRTFGGSGRGQGVGNAADANAASGQISGNERFLRQNRRAGEFVGTDATDIQRRQQPGQQQAFQSAGLNDFRPNQLPQQPAFNQPAPLPQGQGGSNATTIRTRLRVAFEHTAPTPAAVSATLDTRLRRILGGNIGPGASVLLQGRTAVLTGTVASEHHRALAGILVGLEPGVGAVQNDLQVAAPAPSAPAD